MADIIKINGMPLVDEDAVRSVDGIFPDENGNLSLDEILFAAFVEEGVIYPVYNDTAVFINEDGKVFIFDVDKQKDTIASITINGVSPDEKGNISLDDILFTAFEEEGVIQPIYDNDMASFVDEGGVMFVYDAVNQNVKAVGGQANITVNGIEPDAEGNISLPVYRGAYEGVTSNE